MSPDSNAPSTDGMPGSTSSTPSTPFHIHLDETLEELPVTQLIHAFSLPDRTRCQWGKTDRCTVFDLRSEKAGMRFQFDSEHCIRASRASEPVQLSFGLWMAYNWLACRMQKVCLHASCITYQGESLLFIGESGTGKSTQSQLWKKAFPGSVELLNDDSPVVDANPYRDESVRCHVYGSPWSGKTPCYKQERHPLKAIVKIIQAPANRITRLQGTEAITNLLPSFPPALCRDASLTAHYLDMTDHLLKTTPLYRLECLPDISAAQLCHHVIFQAQ